jgi:hypothetical protein
VSSAHQGARPAAVAAHVNKVRAATGVSVGMAPRSRAAGAAGRRSGRPSSDQGAYGDRLLKERVSDVDELVRALDGMARGGSVLDPRVVEDLMAQRGSDAASPLAALTDREREVLQAMSSGTPKTVVEM